MSDRLAELTTLRLGGPAGEVRRSVDEADLVEAVATCDAAGRDLLLVAGGSNLVVADEGFPGTVLCIRTAGVEVVDDGDQVLVTAAAGESWDDLVRTSVEEGWQGIEALSGIPGAVGATPIQNVGAYGQEVSQTIERVRVWDRAAGETRTLGPDECGFGYRTSRFKQAPGAFLVLAVTFRLHRVGQGGGGPVRYTELARRLGVEAGHPAPVADVRRAVLELRAGKGMVLDAADHDTWSAGSFFTNPVLEPDKVPDGAPSYPQPDGTVKTSAAWLIEHAGFGKGYGNDRVSLSTKHTLALTNRGDARTADLLDLAREVRGGVEAAFGVRLVNEPMLVNCAL